MGSGPLRGVLWESHVGLFSVGESYNFSNVWISTFNGLQCFSFSETATYEKISYIGNVAEDQEQQDSARAVIGEIVQVLKVEVYKCCRVCHCKVVERTNSTAECPKCQARVKLVKSPTASSARFLLEDEAGTTVQLTAFGDILAGITKDTEGEDLPDKLLNSPKQQYFFTTKNIVNKVCAL